MTWSKEQVAYFDQHDDLHIAPFRANGIAGTPTWIWSVVADDRLFVRAYNGVHSSWYQSALAQKAGIIVSHDEQFSVRFKHETNETILEKIDVAYEHKYGPSPYVQAIISPKSRVTTIEILLD
ncbi:MAG TPA: DUF2255 family protein [Lactobacillaceae bacterium]|jgi:hypothetical protein